MFKILEYCMFSIEYYSLITFYFLTLVSFYKQCQHKIYYTAIIDMAGFFFFYNGEKRVQ